MSKMTPTKLITGIFFVLTLITLLTLGIAGCTSQNTTTDPVQSKEKAAGDIHVTDFRGKEIVLPGPAQKIVMSFRQRFKRLIHAGYAE